MRPCPLYTPPVAATDWVSRLRVRRSRLLASQGVMAAAKVLITARPRGSRSRNKVIVGEPAFGSLLTRFPQQWGGSGLKRSPRQDPSGEEPSGKTGRLGRSRRADPWDPNLWSLKPTGRFLRGGTRANQHWKSPTGSGPALPLHWG